MALIPCSELSAASWIVDSNDSWEKLVNFGPSGLPAYARLRFLPDPVYRGQSENDVDAGPDTLTESDRIRAALDTLAHYTSTPDECYFCLWEGWGLRRSMQTGARVAVPHRGYYLFSGALSDFGDWGEAGPHRPDLPDPAFIWPADRTWCIANDVDPHWAGIGADASAIDQLVADPRIDVAPADPDQEQPFYY